MSQKVADEKTSSSAKITDKEVEKRFYWAAIAESSDDAIVGKTLDGIITSWNPAAAKLYGFAEQEVIGKSFSLLMSPNRTTELSEILGRIKRGEKIDHYETGRRRKDGTIFDVSVTLSPVKDAEGNIIGISSIARDMTGRRQASQYARSLIEASVDPLVTISPDGKITDVNEATMKVTGVPRERLIGSDFSNYFTEPAKAQEGYQQVFAKGFVADYPLTIRHKDGKLTDVLYNASVYKDVGGNVLGVFAAARDVTAQKQAEGELAEQRKRDLSRLADLERFQKLTVGRELKMVELKKEVEELKKRLGEVA
jgi:PAS domain S-box-containing protein